MLNITFRIEKLFQIFQDENNLVNIEPKLQPITGGKTNEKRHFVRRVRRLLSEAW